MCVCELCFFFQNRVSLYSPGCPGTHSVDQTVLKLTNPPASASLSAGITGLHQHPPAYSFLQGISLIRAFEAEITTMNMGATWWQQPIWKDVEDRPFPLLTTF